MTARNDLRLLPWSGPEGKPCYLSTDDKGGYMSRLADNLEQASDTLDDQDADPEDLRRLTVELTGTLRDVLRVATSRGHLLEVSEPQRV
ncbi:hypothetical protein ACWGDT_37110 [Streptomyces avermitilis]